MYTGFVMRFLLDENLENTIKEVLESKRHICISLPLGTKDSEIAHFAKLFNLIIITKDKDFLNHFNYPAEEFFGIFYIQSLNATKTTPTNVYDELCVLKILQFLKFNSCIGETYRVMNSSNVTKLSKISKIDHITVELVDHYSHKSNVRQFIHVY